MSGTGFDASADCPQHQPAFEEREAFEEEGKALLTKGGGVGVTDLGIRVVGFKAEAHGLGTVHRPTSLDLHLLGLMVHKRHATTAAVQIHSLQLLQTIHLAAG